MKKENLTYNLNLHPNLLASTLIEQENYSIENIIILPDPNVQANQRNEITTVKTNVKEHMITIHTKTIAKERQILLSELEEDSYFRSLLNLMEKNTNEFKTRLFLEERKHILGTSQLHANILKTPSFLNEQQQKIMAYYLPWKNEIKGDLKLTMACFKSAIGYPVKMKLEQPKLSLVEGIAVGNWILDGNDKMGGLIPGTKACVKIEVGPIPLNEVENYLPGTPNRRFWEAVLFPNFLSENWEWETCIQVKKEKSKNNSPSTNGLGFIGINSYIV